MIIYEPTWKSYIVQSTDPVFSIDECNKIIKLGRSLPLHGGRIGVAPDEKGKSKTDHKIRQNKISWIPFSKAVLWQNKNLGFDKKLLKYAEDNNVKSFIFSDPIKGISLRIGIKSAISNGKEDNFGQGVQWYIPKSIMKKLDKYQKTPYVKKELII